MAIPNFLFGFLDFNIPLLRSAFPHSDKSRKNTSVLVGTVLKELFPLFLDRFVAFSLNAYLYKLVQLTTLVAPSKKEGIRFPVAFF